jgi:hypothetical protein
VVSLPAGPLPADLYRPLNRHQVTHCFRSRAGKDAAVTLRIAATQPAGTIDVRGNGVLTGATSTGALDRAAPEFHIALDLARPWRTQANQDDIYRNRRVEDARSTDRTCT